MARTSGIKRGRLPTTSPRSYMSVPMHGARRVRGRTMPFVTGKQGLFIMLAALAAPILAFSLSLAVRNWALGALGYGLIPLTTWTACFVFALRYKRGWIKRFWRVWLGSAWVVAVSLGIMSMFHASRGVMEGASIGGNWGQYLGGSPVVLGGLKVAVLILVGPLLLFPVRAAPIYRRVAGKVLRGWVLTLKWLVTRVGRSVSALRKHRSSGEPEEGGEERLLRRLSNVSKTALRSIPGVPDTESTEGTVGSPTSAESKKEGGRDRHGHGMEKVQGWQLPSFDLLGRGEDRPVPQAVLQQLAHHIEDTLGEHRVEVAVEDIRAGPRVIRFGLVPGWMKKYLESRGVKSKSNNAPPIEISRVKVQSILLREKDLALALKTPYLRMEAPVPGESLIGLEMPNPYPRRVALRSVAESPPFAKIVSKGGLAVALGQDTGGEPVVADLSELPHLLIAGATGSGKSVCINSIVASLLLANRPDRLRMLMVDPKRVELTPFNGIPHLIAPAIVDTDEVLVVLRAVQNEMLRRYKLMEEFGVRNIEGYNRKASVKIPYLVIVIDELADLMMTAAYEAEQSLVRLVQLGRATGIHLILATQRPSVNVVTGLLKANVPARIAFAVVSQVDSRVILDSVGAEKLLGKGDMLLLTSDSPKPMRVQGTFVHDREIAKLVEFWKSQTGPPLLEIPLDDRVYSEPDEADEDEADLLDQARELAERYQHLSPSVIQRRLRIGYSGAVRLMELLEEEGLVQGSGQVATRSRVGRQMP